MRGNIGSATVGFRLAASRGTSDDTFPIASAI